MEMDERHKKSFDFAADYTKQLITLATGIIAFTVTFLKDITDEGNRTGQNLLVVIWISFGLSVCFGIWRQMAMTGTLDPIHPIKTSKEDIALNLPSEIDITILANTVVTAASAGTVAGKPDIKLSANDPLILSAETVVTLPAGASIVVTENKVLMPTITGWNVRRPALLQIFCFLVGLGFTVYFGYSRIFPEKKNTPVKIIFIRETQFPTHKTIQVDTFQQIKK